MASFAKYSSNKSTDRLDVDELSVDLHYLSVDLRRSNPLASELLYKAALCLQATDNAAKSNSQNM